MDRMGHHKNSSRITNVQGSDRNFPITPCLHGRTPGVDGKLPAVGKTVDIASASWNNTIGESELATVWTNPDYDPVESAFYYAAYWKFPLRPGMPMTRSGLVLKIPTDAPGSQQERAYTSPIWYTP